MRPTRPLEDRVWEKADVGDWLDCWPWTAAKGRDGYGKIRVRDDAGRRLAVAHRVAYELLAGPIPDGLVLDHLCRNQACVNPLHLEPVTQAENHRRGIHGVLKPTHCPHGHEFTPENTHNNPSGYRQCRACARDRRRIQYQAKKSRPIEFSDEPSDIGPAA